MTTPTPTPAATELEALRDEYEELKAAYAKLSTQLTHMCMHMHCRSTIKSGCNFQ